MTLSIHLGAHKTASTHLQYSLRQVREQMGAAGMFYADPAILRSALPLGQALAAGDGCPEWAECRRQLDHARVTHPAMLLSEENILGGTHRENMYSRLGTLYPRAAPRLRQVIGLAGGGPATLYLALRDGASFHVSAFALQLSAGNEIELGAYLRGRDPAVVRWSRLVRRLTKVQGVGKIVVWRYEDYAALRPGLLARMVPAEVLPEIPEPAPRNVSITQPGYEWFLEQAMADTHADLRDLFLAARQKFPRRRGHRPLRPLDDETYARSARLYEAEVAAISKLPRVELLRP